MLYILYYDVGYKLHYPREKFGNPRQAFCYSVSLSPIEPYPF